MISPVFQGREKKSGESILIIAAFENVRKKLEYLIKRPAVVIAS